jgi:hypothetical protein
MDKKPETLKYHCPAHPDRAPFCAIGDYTPCRECYFKYRQGSRSVPASLILFLFFLLSSVFSPQGVPRTVAENNPGIQRIHRHDPNIPCRDIIPDYSRHPLYYSDCNSLPYWVEYATKRPWIEEFAKPQNWLSCHPYDDPIARMDVNFDGVTNLKDFAILARFPLYYGTNYGTKYHTRDCTYIKRSTTAHPLITTRGLTPCSVCIIAASWIAENNR